MGNWRVCAVLGPTASGKSSLSVSLAKKWSAEIVSLDSIQVYRHATILSAKATVEEQDGIPHHMIDYLPPNGEPSDYVRQAVNKVVQICQHARVIICGGSMSLCLQLLLHRDIQDLRPWVMALQCDTAYLNQRIALRMNQMLSSGLLSELEQLWELEQLYRPANLKSGIWKIIGYRQFRAWLSQPLRRTDDSMYHDSVAALKDCTQRYAALQVECLKHELLPALDAAGYPVFSIDVQPGKQSAMDLIHYAHRLCARARQEPARHPRARL